MKDKILKFTNRFMEKVKVQDSEFPDEYGEDYLEIDTEPIKAGKNKITVRPFIIHEFEDIKPALDSLRSGYTIALVNIRPLKDKDIIELKRAVNKLKKTCDAISGDIAGLGEDMIIATPSFAEIHRAKVKEAVESLDPTTDMSTY